MIVDSGSGGTREKLGEFENRGVCTGFCWRREGYGRFGFGGMRNVLELGGHWTFGC